MPLIFFIHATILPFPECGIIGIMQCFPDWETCVRSLAWEDPLEKGKATHSSILAWRIPWTVQSMESQRVGHDWVTFTFTVYTLSQSSLLYFITFIKVSSIYFCDLIAHFFLFLNNILLYWCSVVSLNTLLVKDILVASNLCVCVWERERGNELSFIKFMSMFLCGH